jgi:hypothetical protein
MRPVVRLLLPIILPPAIWACSAQPTGVAARLHGRGALFVAPPGLPPGSQIQQCHAHKHPPRHRLEDPTAQPLELLLLTVYA